MRVLTLTLQTAEADALKLALAAVLRDPQTARMIYTTAAEKRAAKRVRRKLVWAAQNRQQAGRLRGHEVV